jgi:hypothetical protein
VKKEIFCVLKTHSAIRCVVKFYSAGVVTRDRKIGSSPEAVYLEIVGSSLGKKCHPL